MKTFIGTLFVSLSLSGCSVDSETSFAITKIQPLDESCATNASDTGQFWVQGTLDISLGNQYVVTPFMESYIDPGDFEQQRTIQLQTAYTRIEFADEDIQSGLDEELLTTETPVAAQLTPKGTSHLLFPALSFGLVNGLGAIPEGEQLLAYIYVRMEGKMAGSTVESEEYRFPIYFCDGCLKASVGLCADLEAAPEQTACYPGQNLPTVCCEDDMGNEVCPAIPADPPMTAL